LLLVSFLPLLEFGRRVTVDTDVKLSAPLVYGAVIIGMAALVFSAHDLATGLRISFRWLIGTPGALLTGVAIFKIWRNQRNLQTKKDLFCLIGIAMAFTCYGLLTLVFTDSDQAMPTWILNQRQFINIFGVPIQLLRTLCALTITAGFFVLTFDANYSNQMDLIKKIEDLHNSKLRLKEHMNELAHVTRLGLMGEMASGIAHEVNQPLTAIANYAQVSLNLIKKENPDLIKLAEVISKTQQQALRAGSIIHRMKDFGKSFSKHHATANINTLINDAIELCIVDLKQNGVLLTLELTNNLPPVFVDLIQVEQVIINLIRNSSEALQSLPENQQRKITIQSQLTLENDIQVSVTDNGLGITEDQKQKILMPFFTTKISGTGMGLSISRSLIEAHEGTLNFNSEFGKGTTFYFTLPIETTKREDEGER
jgi:signal transduction histidine kinase